jgi:hypothetical protein
VWAWALVFATNVPLLLPLWVLVRQKAHKHLIWLNKSAAAAVYPQARTGP